MLNLIGEYECKPDAKGRVLLPSALKKQLATVLDKGFVLKRSVFNTCVELYPVDEWNDVMKQINTLNRFIKKNNDFIRLFTAGVKLQEVDGSGRILLPKDLKAYAGFLRLSIKGKFDVYIFIVTFWETVDFHDINSQ